MTEGRPHQPATWATSNQRQRATKESIDELKRQIAQLVAEPLCVPLEPGEHDAVVERVKSGRHPLRSFGVMR